MEKRFSSKELYVLRNDLPIKALICDQLMLPSKIKKDLFRFLCPCCHGFNTSINPRNNLARCFHCLRNFNTIDLVMTCWKLTFVESVTFLKTYHQNTSHRDYAELVRKNRQGLRRIKIKIT